MNHNLHSDSFMPHGMCYLWKPEILWLNVLSDALIAFAYLSIPIALLVFIKKRDDLEFSWIFRLFAAFIFWCAMTHIISIWVVWNPDYTVQGMVKSVTAILSVITAVMLWFLMPKALAVPGPSTLQNANMKLSGEIKFRENLQIELEESHNKLEERVKARTLELDKLNDELAKSNDELEDYAHITSHDLKEPLRGISIYVDYLVEKHRDKFPDEEAEKLQKIQSLTKRMKQLIESLLFYSKVGKSERALSNIDMNQLLAEVKDSIPEINDEKVIINIQQDIPTVLCDQIRIREVFNNLIYNAIKYNKSDPVTVDIGYTQDQNSLAYIPDGTEKNAIIYYVRDNGIGIEEKHFSKIFTIFKRLHADDVYGTGTGTGLAIVKRIVERHDGEIWLESEPGKGSTFYFTLRARNGK